MSEIKYVRRNTHILILNPNSSKAMTSGMEAAVCKMALSDNIEISTYTAPPAAPASIDNDEDISESDTAVVNDTRLASELFSRRYDAVLVACFSVQDHLVSWLNTFPNLVATGIFTASIMASMPLLGVFEKWGIVTTGRFWEKHLSDGVRDYLGQDRASTNSKFVGVYSSGLNAGDFHNLPEEEVRQRLSRATRALLAHEAVKCVVMGCGGMAGLEDIIRGTAAEVYGADRARNLYIIDGVKAGMVQLQQMVHSKSLYR